jgi:hypothetical protein
MRREKEQEDYGVYSVGRRCGKDQPQNEARFVKQLNEAKDSIGAYVEVEQSLNRGRPLQKRGPLRRSQRSCQRPSIRSASSLPEIVP